MYAGNAHVTSICPYGSVAERSPSKRKVHSSILCGGNFLLPAALLHGHFCARLLCPNVRPRH